MAIFCAKKENYFYGRDKRKDKFYFA